MNIGEQSTLNDLKDLKISFEASLASQMVQVNDEINQVKAIKSSVANQLDGGHVDTGSIYDLKPDGIYTYSGFNMPDVPPSDYVRNDGIMLHMEGQTPDRGISICAGWGGYLSIVLSNDAASGQNHTVSILTKRNTIVDANGFIKTA